VCTPASRSLFDPMGKALIIAIALWAGGIGEPDVSKALNQADSGVSSAKLPERDALRRTLTPAEAEYRSARLLERDGFPAAALIELVRIVKAGPSHPFYSQAVDQLTVLQGALGDEYLIPTVIAAEPVERWSALEAGARARAAYLAAKVEQRKGN